MTVVIPTYRRPEHLAVAIRGLERQRRKPDSVVIGVQEEDTVTLPFIRDLGQQSLLIKVQTVKERGVIASMQSAVTHSTGEIVGLLDDDAEPSEDWMERIEHRFAADPLLGGLGGRDLLQDLPDKRAAEPLTKQVGVLTSHGRIIGNHHRGTGAFREVDLLKGCNCAFRGPLIRELGFEPALRGEGAQVHWEVALCLDVVRRGYRIAYDPALLVKHHIAPRYGDDQTHRHGGGFSPSAVQDMVFNEHFVVWSRTPLHWAARHLICSLALGSLIAPGLIQAARCRLRGDRHLGQRLAATICGIREGMPAGLAARRRIRGTHGKRN